MNEKDDQISSANFWADHYGLIGEYVVKFEWISVHLRFVMQVMIEGAQTTHHSKIKALLADANVGTLLNSYRSLMRTSDRINHFGVTVISRFHSRAIKLIEQRNEIVHGMLAVGWPSDSIQPTDKILGYKLKNRSDGATSKPISISLEELRTIIQECEKTMILIQKMYKCYVEGGWEDIFAVTSNSLELKNQGG